MSATRTIQFERSWLHPGRVFEHVNKKLETTGATGYNSLFTIPVETGPDLNFRGTAVAMKSCWQIACKSTFVSDAGSQRREKERERRWKEEKRKGRSRGRTSRWKRYTVYLSVLEISKMVCTHYRLLYMYIQAGSARRMLPILQRTGQLLVLKRRASENHKLGWSMGGGWDAQKWVEGSSE